MYSSTESLFSIISSAAAVRAHLSGSLSSSHRRAAEPSDAVALVQSGHLLACKTRRGVQPVAAFASGHTLAIIEAQTLASRHCERYRTYQKIIIRVP